MNMIIIDLAAFTFIGISHILLYLQLIRYPRLSLKLVIPLGIAFTILLVIVVTASGYPEFNIILLMFFLLSLGLLKKNLSFSKSLYFALFSMVAITLVKMVLFELFMALFIVSPFHLYVWTGNVIHFIVSVIIAFFVVISRHPVQKITQAIIDSRFLYRLSYFLLAAGLMILFILTVPAANLLSFFYEEYGTASYIAAYILFFLLLIMMLISFHLTKEQMLVEQQKRSDRELLDYVQKLERMHEDLAAFRHDYINILLALDEGIRTKNLAQIEKIYHDVVAPTAELLNNHELDIVKLSRIAIPEIKSVLSVKLAAAQQQQVKVLVDIPDKIENIRMPVLAFIRMISILLDNAVEEAVRSTEKMLQVAFFETEDCQYFVVRNSCKAQTVDLRKIYEKHYSEKEGMRGYGLFSLKRLVEKMNHVTLETTFVAPYFTQTIMIKRQ